ncbi:unnamed protein product, partial [Ectocarpus sp. 12 AP-2014]
LRWVDAARRTRLHLLEDTMTGPSSAPLAFPRRDPKPANVDDRRIRRRFFSLPAVNAMITLFLLATTASAGAGLAETVSSLDETTSNKDWRTRRVSEPTAHDGFNTTSTPEEEGRRKLYHIDVNNAGEPCERNPLWERMVNPANYKFGCQEIEEMLSGDMTLIGTGRIRTVYMVNYQGETVVVKTLQHVKELRREKAHLSMHRREVLTLDVLRGQPHIVGMLGFCQTTVVTEYHSDNFLSTIFGLPHGRSLGRVVSLALDVARGLQASDREGYNRNLGALHETVGAIHLDMKPQQLLIDGTGRGKVNDFNSAHLMSVDRVTGEYCPANAARPARTVPWRAPENVAGKPLSEKVDIYAMGMIFFSLISGGVPFPDQEAFERAYEAKLRPEIDPSWHKGFTRLFQDMWHEDPERRPSARQVVLRLEDLLRELLVASYP